MGLIDWFSSETERKNEFKPTNFGQTQNYNANAFQYGGQAGVADTTAANYGLMGRQAQGREGVGLNTMQADQSRAGMGQAAGLMMGRATGAAPSIAGMQAQQDMQRAVAAQSSAAAGARGPAALALAQQNAAGNTANAQSAISGQAQVNAAQERLAAEQAAFGAYGGMRGMDESRAMGQAQLMDQQRGRNDAFQMGMTQNEMAVRNAQMQGQMAQQGLLAGSHQQGQQLGAGIAGQNAQTNDASLGMVMGAGQGLASALASMSDARAKMNAQPMGGLMMSDVTSKVGIAQLGGPNQKIMSADGAYDALRPMSGPGEQSFDVGNAAGGMDVGKSYERHSKFGTRFQDDPTGGMGSRGVGLFGNALRGMTAGAAGASRAALADGGGGGGGGLMLSDDRAKLRDREREAYMLGRAHGVERNSDFAYGGAPREGEEIVDRDPWRSTERMAEQRPEWLEGYMGRDGSREAGTHYAAQSEMGGAAGDRMTGQLARGLQPYAYEYKPGFGTEGQKVGPMAQEMASNDVTATAVRRDPGSGLMSIDRDDGLKVALGGVGHLAAKQSAQEEMLRGLLAQREEPIDDLSYLAHARRQRRGF